MVLYLFNVAMNYLAHLFLSDGTPASLIGNLLGDFVKGSAVNLYSEDIRNGGVADLRYERLNMQIIKTIFHKTSGFLPSSFSYPD
ncbi:hypothetical protein [Lyngbya sp. CCAP 1446/10]|uniref:ACP phosphodiesterase n=1 Tax=Lyngbya sp. CCAP 1446/10 TaxID=439293 RepID=UPI002237594F|nr:hypothetical protein [Lyngbya sp. CCAP 1446/10]